MKKRLVFISLIVVQILAFGAICDAAEQNFYSVYVSPKGDTACVQTSTQDEDKFFRWAIIHPYPDGKDWDEVARTEEEYEKCVSERKYVLSVHTSENKSGNKVYVVESTSAKSGTSFQTENLGHATGIITGAVWALDSFRK